MGERISPRQNVHNGVTLPEESYRELIGHDALERRPEAGVREQI